MIYIVNDSYWHEWNILQMKICDKEEVKVVERQMYNEELKGQFGLFGVFVFTVSC